MYRIQIYAGRGMGWRMGRNTYTQAQVEERAKKLQSVGIKFRIVNEALLFR